MKNTIKQWPVKSQTKERKIDESKSEFFFSIFLTTNKTNSPLNLCLGMMKTLLFTSFKKLNGNEGDTASNLVV